LERSAALPRRASTRWRCSFRMKLLPRLSVILPEWNRLTNNRESSLRCTMGIEISAAAAPDFSCLGGRVKPQR
jgi:hypothetical protein